MSGVVQMIAGLVVVLAAIGGAAWLARRAGLATAQGPRILNVVSSVSLSPRERVVVVEVKGQWLVLGVAPGRVSRLAEMAKDAS